MPDEAVTKCTSCGSNFSALARRVCSLTIYNQPYCNFLFWFCDLDICFRVFESSHSITAETVEKSSVISAPKGALLSHWMRKHNQFEFVISAWYIIEILLSFTTSKKTDVIGLIGSLSELFEALVCKGS